MPFCRIHRSKTLSYTKNPRQSAKSNRNVKLQIVRYNSRRAHKKREEIEPYFAIHIYTCSIDENLFADAVFEGLAKGNAEIGYNGSMDMTYCKVREFQIGKSAQ